MTPAERAAASAASKARIATMDAERAEKDRAFWQARHAEYAESDMAKAAAIRGEHDHCRLRGVDRLWATCDATMTPDQRELSGCATKRIRWMAAQPESGHIGRNGRRLAEIYGLRGV